MANDRESKQHIITKETEARPEHGKYESLVLSVFVLTTLLIILTGFFHTPRYSLEAFYRAMAANDLLDGLSRGRQALVGSLQMAPLPTVFLAILAALPIFNATEALCVAIAAGCGLLLCRQLNDLWRAAGIPAPLRAAGGGAILLLPGTATSIMSGNSTMLFIATAVGGMCFLVDWLDTARLRSLTYAALLLGLALTVRFQTLFIAMAAALAVFVAIVSKKPEKGLAEGTSLIFITPISYMILLWLGGNWLILGNPFFLLRGALRFTVISRDGAGELLLTGGDWGTLGAALLIGAAPLMPGLIKRKKVGAAWGGLIFAAAIVAAMIASYFFIPHPDVNKPDDQIAKVMAGLESRHDNTSFIVTGFEGYEFSAAAGDNHEDVWIHVMHLEQTLLDRIIGDFRGRSLFLLVNSRDLSSGWINMGLEWAGPHTHIPEQFFFVEKTGDWLVFEVFCPDAPTFFEKK